MDGTIKVSKARLQEIFASDETPKKLPYIATRRLFQRFLDDHGYVLPEEPAPLSNLIEEYCTFLRDLRGYAPEVLPVK